MILMEEKAYYLLPQCKLQISFGGHFQAMEIRKSDSISQQDTDRRHMKQLKSNECYNKAASDDNIG